MSGESFNQTQNGNSFNWKKVALWGFVGLFALVSIANMWLGVSREQSYRAAAQESFDRANELESGSKGEEGGKEEPRTGEVGPDPGLAISDAATAALVTSLATLENEQEIQQSQIAKMEELFQEKLDEIAVAQRESSQQASQDLARVVALVEQEFDVSAQEDRESVIDESGDLFFEESGGVIFENDSGSGSGSSTKSSSQNNGNTGRSRNNSGYQMFRPSKKAVTPSIDQSLLDTVTENVESEEEIVEITLPATSWANAETLYGVACPIVSNVVAGVSSANGGVRVPVVIPVRSTFKGPNGDIASVGTANLMAECYGQRTSDSKIGRAVLEIKKISFVDSSKESHFEAVEGVVIDRETEAIYIEGPIDKARTNNIWTRAINAAVSTAAFGFSAQGVVLTKGDGAGGYEQSFTGDPVKDMAAQGVGGYFNDLQSGFAEMMNATVDTVGVPSGKDIRVVLTNEITFKVKVKKDDIYSSENAFLF